MINNGQKETAMKSCLKQLVNGIPESEIEKQNAVKTSTDVMSHFKKSEIQNFCNSLSIDELDVLMKLVYKGFEIR